MDHQATLLVTRKPTQRHAEARVVVWSLSVLVVRSSRDRRLLLQPLL